MASARLGGIVSGVARLVWCVGGLVSGVFLSAAQSPPELLVDMLGNSQVRLSWTNSAVGFALEQVDRLPAPGPWSPVLPGPQLANQQFSVVLSSNPGDRFFRLTTRPGGLPMDPASSAPSVPLDAATMLADATAFLYTGLDPLQTGVTNGTIEVKRAAVVRGQVRQRDHTPLSGATISILNHPELGQTVSRGDGLFDLAVNGGGGLVVKYQKTGFTPVQRQLNVPWQDYVWVADVVMTPFDTAVTTVDLNGAAMQVARGSAVSDADGARRATILFPAGTSAELILLTGATQTVSSLNIRATEYTVGTNGPAAMPALLPPSSGYTYCVELSADEAVAVGATEVRFNQALPVYVENFLGFPVGGAVPTGYYDRQRGQWIASANGRVIKVLSITGGLADLDTDGDDVTDDAAKLATLGVTAEEQARLAELYTPGQTLWRVPITHFTPWDCNWPYGPPANAIGPPGRKKKKPSVNRPNKECGSVIGIEDQTLGESVSVAGTPWQLHYQSERTPGRTEAYTLEIPLSGAESLPASLRAIRVEVSIAGRLYRAAFTPALNLTYTVIWDGKDGYGRLLQGEQPALVKVSYDYPLQYYAVRNDFYNSFARAEAAGTAVSGSRGASIITLSQAWTERVGAWDARGLGLGGWSLGIQHAYDFASRTLLLGDGQQRRAEAIGSIITTVAGNGMVGFSGDGGPATLATWYQAAGLAFGSDGTLFIADKDGHRIRRVGPDGTITTVAGNGTGGFSGDGGPASAAALFTPFGVALGSDDSLFIADANNNRIRRVGPNGIITTVAGTGVSGFSGDGGPAVTGQLGSPRDVAVGPDGSLFIADVGNQRIRHVGTDGIITTVAGTGVLGFSGDSGPATAAALYTPSGVAVGSDGSLLIADSGNRRIRRVGPDGIITTVAGTGVYGSSGDGGPATTANLVPSKIAVGPDGSLFIAENGNNRVRRVGPDGVITTIAGNGVSGFNGDDGLAVTAQLNTPSGLAIGADGSVFIADSLNRRIRRVRSAPPDLSATDVLLSSEDGRELYTFNSTGRHLKTLDALTGALRYQFSYSADGYLTSVTDGNSNVTIIERVGAAASAIVAPGGQRTALTVSSDGWLLSATNPAAEAHAMSYSAEGLLQRFINPLGNTNAFTYDTAGRLSKDEDPDGGSITLDRTEQSDGYTVTTTSALGRVRFYRVEQLSTGAIRRTVTQPGGAQTVTVIGPDGSEQTTNSDGSSSTVTFGPDPRWGMLAPVATSVTLKSPGGLTRTITTVRTAQFANPLDVLSLTKLTSLVTDNGALSTSVYDATARSLTTRTAAGRTATFTLDALGRLTQEQIAGLTPVTYTYDARGFFRAFTQGSGPDGRTNRFDYNSGGSVINLTDPREHSLNFAYDAAGRMTTQTSADDQIIQLAYDANGNNTGLTPPGRPTHTFAYSARDLKTRYSPPAVVAGTNFTLYAYNLDRELTSVKLPGQITVQYEYSPSDCNCGRLGSLIQARGTNTYRYEVFTGNLTGVQAPAAIGLAFTYDGSLLTTETRSGPLGGSISNSYDASFRLSTQCVNGGAPIAFHFDPDSLLMQAGALSLIRNPTNGLIAATALGLVTNQWVYNDFGEIASASVTFNTTALYAATFTRDQSGRILQKTESVNGVSTDYAFSYDLGDRLAAVLQNGTPVAAYAYDSNDNRITVTGPGSSTHATYDDQDRLIQYGATFFTYTDSGNLKTREVGGSISAYQYDALGNLMAVTLPNGTQIDYLVDGFNRRIGKRINGVLVQGFLYDGALRCLAELDGSGNVVSRFVYGTRNSVPDYLVKNGVTYRILADHLGSPRLVIDVATGTIAQRMDYDEFGQVLNDTNPGFQPFGFAGGLYDGATKLVRFGARDFDAETGRWTAKDPIDFDGEDTNLYGYVLSDPVNFQDGSGQARVSVGGALWVSSKDTKLVKDASYTADVLKILQPGDEVKWLGRDRATGLSRVEISLAGGKKCRGYVHPSSLTPKAPSSQIDFGDGKPVDGHAVASSGAATRS